MAARKLLPRLRFERFTLPVLQHILVTIDTAGLTLPVNIEGSPSAISFDPVYLADALEIGATLRLRASTDIDVSLSGTVTTGMNSARSANSVISPVSASKDTLEAGGA